ncbi:hypothetical protein HOG17_05520 [Candidatus Peregrinibacteria bacterium]|mgnify:CR=1 FL=1|jgi:hypothetical protein|nr:hypothetical protein [Candidatus Peregrinibacteria bacterium]MBT4148138.1 hypothetical protein [Candidatus Peregrinibacteria bacterium]MBT4366625.1 hypothetical protein [Candidatus Peregrinibacteria bacterium]MBT4455612.1 hypothetical protein [Candidatus Peregrinibacteria bacterium]
MVEDKISLALKDIAKIKADLKEVKKDMKSEEKLVTDQYVQLKSASKDLKAQVKEMEEDHLGELADDDFYNKLRELRLQKEEDLALANEKLFKAVAELPQKYCQIKMETEAGSVNVQIQPEMRVYVNGREEKKRG